MSALGELPKSLESYRTVKPTHSTNEYAPQVKLPDRSLGNFEVFSR
jgi:hypothetical protein